MQEDGAVIPAKAQACIETGPKVTAEGRFQGVSITSWLSKNDIKKPWGQKKKKSLAIKCFSSNKDTTNKYI